MSQRLLLVVYLSLLLSFNVWNKHKPVDSWLCTHLLECSWCCHMFFDYSLLTDKKILFQQSWHCNLLLLEIEETIAYNLFDMHCFRTIKQKVYLLLENLDQLNNLSLAFCLCWYFWLIFIPVAFFKNMF